MHFGCLLTEIKQLIKVFFKKYIIFFNLCLSVFVKCCCIFLFNKKTSYTHQDSFG